MSLRGELIFPNTLSSTAIVTSRISGRGFLLVAAVFVAAVWVATTPYMAGATCSYMLLLCGLLNRARRALHVQLMSSGIGLDLLIVALLEFTRSAINTSVHSSLSLPQQLHISFSAIAVILYFPVIFFGLQRLKASNVERTRRLHLRFGLVAFAFRTLGFLFMFSMLWKDA